MQYVSRSMIGHLTGVVLVLLVPIALRVDLDVIVTDVNQLGQFPWWVVQFGTLGETIVIYSLFVSFVSYIIVPILIFVLGYHYGKTQTKTPFQSYVSCLFARNERDVVPRSEIYGGFADTRLIIHHNIK